MLRAARSFGLGLAVVTLVVPAVAVANTAIGIDPSVVVFDQPAAGNSVKVSYAYLPAKGYVAVYGADTSGKPVREVLGVAEIAAGDHRDVKVTLANPLKAGQQLWVSLYKDADNKGGFDAKADRPVWGEALPAHNAFKIR